MFVPAICLLVARYVGGYRGCMKISPLDFLFPRRSLEGAEGLWVTHSERSHLRPDIEIVSEAALRGRGITHLDTLASAIAYDASPVVRRAIWNVKYGRMHGPENELIRLLSAVARKRRRTRTAMSLCPVPLHWVRDFHRGFNLATVLANGIEEECGLPVDMILRRVRSTGHQAHRDRNERLHALRRAFALKSNAPVPRHIVLIDDIATTGATLDACARTLKEGGAVWVEAWVVARG